MRSRRLFLITLSALALGVLFSCAPDAPESLYPQNRRVRGVDFNDLTPSAEDSIRKGLYPDSLSGWILYWELPLERAELNAIYIFGDSIPKDVSKPRLVSGTGDMDLQGLPFLAKLAPTDTSWEIGKFFKDASGKWLQGRNVRSDTTYHFSIWLRYNKDAAGDPVNHPMRLGDVYAPELPILSDSVGQTNFVVRLPRPSDQTSRFDTTRTGSLSSIEIRYWSGDSPADSVDTVANVNRVKSVEVPKTLLQDRAVDSFRLELAGLRYYTKYWYILTVTDSVGLRSQSSPLDFTTRDSLPPAPPTALSSRITGFDTLHLTWQAASDSFGPGGVPLPFPNHHIAQYTLRLDGLPIDSLVLTSDTNTFTASGSWPPASTKTRFRWSGSLWTWTWPNLRPGKAFTVSISARDLSGNDTKTAPSIGDSAGSPAVFSCPAGYQAITGTGSIKNYCIEEREHRSNGVAQKSVTWKQAVDICAADGGFLCSDSQWVRACETNPSGSVVPYGSVETGFFNGTIDYLDSAIWLNKACQLGTGDSSSLYATSSDPRCVSGWGVFDMPGGLAEWTRDVYHTTPGASGKRDSNLAWIDTSDLTGKSDVGTIRGGTWLLLDQPDRALSSATCRERNYPAFSNLYDSLANGKRRRANPEGKSIGVGFRCCRAPNP